MSKSLWATFTAKPGARERIAEMLVGYAADVTAEPGNVAFEAYTLAEDPNSFWIHEIYADEDAFAAHLAAPYGGPFNDELVTLIEEPESVLTFLDPVAAP